MLSQSQSPQSQKKQEQQEQQQEQEGQYKEQKKFFIVRQRNGKYNTYSPIAYYGEDGYYRGLAIFTDLWEAERYLQKYQDKFAVRYLENSINRNNEIRKGKNRVVRSSDKDHSLKIFIEKTVPTLITSGNYFMR